MNTTRQYLSHTTKTTCAIGLSLAGLSLALRADWNPGDPSKWFQLPDLTPTGLDINATFSPSGGPAGPNGSLGLPGRIVADDFRCTLTGPITDIHIWGSWLNDQVTTAPLRFHLSIHSDIPAGTPNPSGNPIPWSRPGDVLWSVDMAPTASRLYAPAQERFWDPLNQPDPIGVDTQVYQYNFLIDEALAFTQTVDTIYWLDVQAIVEDSTTVFGWKTTNPLETPHFNDDATWNNTGGIGGPLLIPDWSPLVYLDGPFSVPNNLSIDMAFALTTTAIPEPSTWAACGFVVLLAGRSLWRRLRR